MRIADPGHSLPLFTPPSKSNSKRSEYPGVLELKSWTSSSTVRSRHKMSSSRKPPPSYARQTQSSQPRGAGHSAGRGSTINAGRRAVSSAVVVAPTQLPNSKFHLAPTFPLCSPFPTPKKFGTCVSKVQCASLIISGRRAAFAATAPITCTDPGPWRLSPLASPLQQRPSGTVSSEDAGMPKLHNEEYDLTTCWLLAAGCLRGG